VCCATLAIGKWDVGRSGPGTKSDALALLSGLWRRCSSAAVAGSTGHVGNIGPRECRVNGSGMILLGLLPIAALALTCVVFLQRTGRFSTAILLGGLVWSFAVALGTEVLSFMSAIDFGSVLAAWVLGTAILLFLLSRLLTFRAIPAQAPLPAIAPTERMVTVVLVIFGALTLLIALVGPPNNWDSQTYHLARIEHWIQNRSLAFYPSAIKRQLAMPYFAETVVLQFRILSGTDRLDNLVQWLAGAGSVIAVGQIALLLGATPPGVALARLTAAALPIGILQSTSTQNDLVVTFFLLCLAERLLAWRQTRLSRDSAFMAIAAKRGTR